MTSDFARVRTVFEAVLEQPFAARPAFLAQQCAGDDALRGEVEALLASDERPSPFAAVLDRTADALLGWHGDTLVGSTIGAFRLRSVLGGGGMGTVYAAEQLEPSRLVALKVLSLGLGGDAAARRFRHEAEVLARLRHPGIAQVYAVGVHRCGDVDLPWFAMELVAGARDLTAFADAKRLPVRARVELLLAACDAVHHGHLNGIVHRDLKPQNVLVDEDGRVKVIDFGIARSMAPDGAPVRTEAGFVLGTLAYMSPEQIAGGAVDLRADIYALGVVAFELLAGRRPYVFDGMAPWQAARIVETQDPPRLRQVERGIDGDLDVVIGKALRRDPAERYASVAALADDLRAWLDARPVAARPTSAFYQVRMFARRRRGLVAAIGTVLVVAASALVVLALQNEALRANEVTLGQQNEELRRKELALATQNEELVRSERLASRVAKFARDFLAESDVMTERGADYTVREALEQVVRAFDSEAFPDPVVEAELRDLAGETYRGLSLFAAAEPQLQRAAALRREALGPSHAATVRNELSLVLLYREQDRLDEAVQLVDELQARTAASLDADDPLRLTVLHNQALLWKAAGRFRDAEKLYREVAAARERVLGPDHDSTTATLQSLGTLLLGTNRAAEARDVLSDCLERATRGGAGKTVTLQVADNLAEAWRDLGDLPRAAAMHRETMAACEQHLGPDHALTIGCGYHLLLVLHKQRDHVAMKALVDELLPRCERTFGAENRRTMDLLAAGAAAALHAGDAATACRHFGRAYDVKQKKLGPSHPDTFLAGQNLAEGQLAAGDGAAAIATTTVLTGRLPQSPDVPPVSAAYTQLLHARALHASGSSREAEPVAAAAHATLGELLPASHPQLLKAAALLAELRRQRDG